MQRFKKFAMKKGNFNKYMVPVIFGAKFGPALAHPSCNAYGKFAKNHPLHDGFRNILLNTQAQRRSDVLGLADDGWVRTPMSATDTYNAWCRLYAGMASRLLP